MRTNLTVAGIIAVVTLLLVGIHLVSDTEEFSRYNHGWNGTSDLFTELNPHQSEDIMQIIDLPEEGNATLLLIAPSGMYPTTDIEEIRAFTEAGNTLVIADETGMANPILQGIGSGIAIQPGYIGSIDHTYNDAFVIVTSPSSDQPLVINLSNIILNRCVSLTGGEPLVQTSMMSWIDADSDRRISGDESFGKRVVMAREKIGDGEVIVISDSAIFINSMLKVGDEWGNREFVSRLIHYRPLLYLEQDLSRTAVPEGPGKALYLLRSNPDLEILLVMGVLLAPAILIFRRKIWGLTKESLPEDELRTISDRQGFGSPDETTGQSDNSGQDHKNINLSADQKAYSVNRERDDQ